MKISKIFLFTAAALALCGACDDSDDKVDPSTTEDKISISPTEGVVGSKGGDVSTMVTSSGEWTLEGAENAYVTPSAAKGKDGDIVAFTVKANDKEEDQVFTYTFACGKKTAPFKITLKKKASETEEQLELFYAEESNIIPREGGKVTVLVTSSGAWTLEGTADFVHPSSTSGEDGAEVVFEVDPNETEQERSADYVFKMGSKQVEFQIVEKGEVPETIEITSKAEMRLAYTAEERLAVELSTNVNYRDLTAEIVSEAEGWLTYTIARPTEGGADTDVTAYFSMAKNDGETPREATVTIKGVKNGAAVLKVTQLPQSKIEPEKLAYFLDVEAQTLDIPVTANVEFDVTVGEGADGWFTYNNADDSGLHFTVEALVDGSARSCEVVLTEKNAPDNAEPLTVNIKISQNAKERPTLALSAKMGLLPVSEECQCAQRSEERSHGGAGQYSGYARSRFVVYYYGYRGEIPPPSGRRRCALEPDSAGHERRKPYGCQAGTFRTGSLVPCRSNVGRYLRLFLC